MEIYVEAFPEEERRGVENIKSLLESERRYEFRVAKTAVGGVTADGGDEVVVGLITTWRFESFVYVEHLAVDGRMRGGRFGSEIMKRLIGDCGKPVILEVELLDEEGITAEQRAQREARLRFYHRLGFEECHLPYIQPSYTKGEPATLPLMLMECGGRLLPGEFGMVKGTLYSDVYGVEL